MEPNRIGIILKGKGVAYGDFMSFAVHEEKQCMIQTLSSHPTAFLIAYDSENGVEVFESQTRGFLKILAKTLNVWILTVFSNRCFHHMGGAKMMLRELKSWIKPGDFVYKTDVYSCYASMNHKILFQQLRAIDWTQRLMATVIGYCERTILRQGPSLHCTRGIPKGGSSSSVLGALYLTPLDVAMERWMARGDCFYARFQDDIILVSRKRHLLRSMRKEMFQILNALQLSLWFEKTFVGRSQKGFDLLGYHITPQNLSPSGQTQKRAFDKARQRYAQGGDKSLQEYPPCQAQGQTSHVGETGFKPAFQARLKKQRAS